MKLRKTLRRSTLMFLLLYVDKPDIVRTLRPPIVRTRENTLGEKNEIN